MGDDNRRRLELRDMEPPPSPPSYDSGLSRHWLGLFVSDNLDGKTRLRDGYLRLYRNHPSSAEEYQVDPIIRTAVRLK